MISPGELTISPGELTISPKEISISPGELSISPKEIGGEKVAEAGAEADPDRARHGTGGFGTARRLVFEEPALNVKPEDASPNNAKPLAQTEGTHTRLRNQLDQAFGFGFGLGLGLPKP